MIKIFLDIDGVMADFYTAGLALFGIKPESCEGTDWWIPNIIGCSTEEWWTKCDSVEFWANLEKMHDADQILALCEAKAGRDVFFLSNPGPNPTAAMGKLLWVKKHYPIMYNRTILTFSKWACAAHNAILVDDLGSNVTDFEDDGGSAILVPRPWNKNRQHSHRTVEFLREYLD